MHGALFLFRSHLRVNLVAFLTLVAPSFIRLQCCEYLVPVLLIWKCLKVACDAIRLGLFGDSVLVNNKP